MSKDYFQDRRLTENVISEATLYFEGSGGLVRLDKKVMTIGRDKNCDIVLNASTVSRNHARIFMDGADWYLEDLGSVNGLSVNGRSLRPHETVRLFNNCCIVIADNLNIYFHNNCGAVRNDVESSFQSRSTAPHGMKEWKNPYYTQPDSQSKTRILSHPRQLKYDAYESPVRQVPPESTNSLRHKNLRLIVIIALTVIIATMAAAWGFISGTDKGHINTEVYSLDYHRFMGKTKWTVTDNLTDMKTKLVSLNKDGSGVEQARFELEDGTVKTVFFMNDLPLYATVSNLDGTVTKIVYNSENRVFTVNNGGISSTYDYEGNRIVTEGEEDKVEIGYTFGAETVTVGGKEVIPVMPSARFETTSISIHATATTEISNFQIFIRYEGSDEWELCIDKPVDDGRTMDALHEFSELVSITGIAVVPECYENLYINDVEVCNTSDSETKDAA